MNNVLKEFLYGFNLAYNGLRIEDGVDEEIVVEDEIVTKDQDGNTLIKIDDKVDGPEPGSDEEKPEEDKSKAKDSDVDEDDPGEVIDDAYKGKNLADIIEMHKNSERKISELGGKLSKYKSDEDLTTLSPEELAARIPAVELEKVYTDVRTNLTKAEDELISIKAMSDDEDEITAAQSKVDKLKAKAVSAETNWMKKRQDEQINGRFTSADNKQFIADQTAAMKKAGIEIPDAELPALFDRAKEYSSDGKMTVQTVAHAMLDLYTAEKVQKFYTISGEQKARKGIKDANGKVRPKVDTNQSGKKGKYISIDQANPKQIKNAVRNMSDEELYKK